MMTVSELTTFFGWCTVINVSILCISTIALVAFKGFIVKVYSNMLSVEQSDLPKYYFNYLAMFKLGVILLNITPYIALKLMA
ncbi:DUF6868 family protein [Thalassotalea sp. PLHSN55]|uniref:DUF6868 family protein n=1 Tax=Thalassotalea sp. PLHSN55 TaxID=3435888 RepID=UPI003F86E90E